MRIRLTIARTARSVPIGPLPSLMTSWRLRKTMRFFSSETGGISIFERMADFNTSSFIQMDPPKHDVQRKKP